MQFTAILICLMVISTIQAALVTKTPKPKLNLTYSQNLQSLEILKNKSPEERSLFSKNYTKYVNSSEQIYKIAIHKPLVHGTRKPLMKKRELLDNNNEVVENETEQPIISTGSMSEKEFTVNPVTVTVLDGEEIIIEAVEDKLEENNKKLNNKVEDKLRNDFNEIITETTDTVNKRFPGSKYATFQYSVKLIEVSSENIDIEAFSDVSDITKNYKENEMPDWTQFIFIDPVHKLTENNKISSDELEEYVTTEIYEESEIIRQRRGSNVIEEENLASTVAGYKYNWKNTRLSNDVVYKNIHS